MNKGEFCENRDSIDDIDGLFYYRAKTVPKTATDVFVRHINGLMFIRLNQRHPTLDREGRITLWLCCPCIDWLYVELLSHSKTRKEIRKRPSFLATVARGD